MSLHTYSSNGRTIRARFPLRDWGVTLARKVAEAFGNAPGEHFAADVLKQDKLFPVEWPPIKRRDCLNRLYAGPVSVDDLVFELGGQAKIMYQKTKKLVARRGVIEGDGAVPAAHHKSNAPYVPVPTQPSFSQPPPPAFDSQITTDALDRIRVLEERVTFLDGELCMYGAPKDGVYMMTPREFVDWKYAMERNLSRLIDHVIDRHVFAEWETKDTYLGLHSKILGARNRQRFEEAEAAERIRAEAPAKTRPKFYEVRDEEDDDRSGEEFAE